MVIPADADRLDFGVYRLVGWTGSVHRAGGPVPHRDGPMWPTPTIEILHAPLGSDSSVCTVESSQRRNDWSTADYARRGIKRKLHGRRFEALRAGAQIDDYMRYVSELVRALPLAKTPFEVDGERVDFEIVRHGDLFGAAAQVGGTLVTIESALPEETLALERLPVTTFTELRDFIRALQAARTSADD